MKKIDHNFNFFNRDGKIFLNMDDLLSALKKSVTMAESEQEALAYITYFEMFSRFKKNVSKGKNDNKDDEPDMEALAELNKLKKDLKEVKEALEKPETEDVDSIIDKEMQKLHQNTWYGRIIWGKK
jgi:hypothetical protein